MMGGGGKVARTEKKADKAMDKAVKASKNMAGPKDRAKADKAASKVAVVKDKLSTLKEKAVGKAALKFADKASKYIKKAK